MTTQQWRMCEVVVTRTESELLGEVCDFSEEARGYTRTALLKGGAVRGNARLSEIGRRCLANAVPGLRDDCTIVHIPMTDIGGKRLGAAETMQAFWWACSRYGVPLWTQSGVKSRTFVFVRQDSFDALSAGFDKATDGPRFASYASLIFSEVTGSPATFEIESVEPPADGEDGNSISGFVSSSVQFRAMKLDDGKLAGVAKGVFVPLKDATLCSLNETQVKFGSAGSWLVATNSAVSAKPLRQWISCEPIVLLRDEPEVRDFLCARVRDEVADYLSLLTEERRVDLLARLRGLEVDDDFSLVASQRAVIEALRSPLPLNCPEVEGRVTRFALKEICTQIIPSGGIWGWSSLLVQSDDHGVGRCAWKDAKAFALRIPCTGADAIIPLPKNPFVKGKGMVVTSEVAKSVSGDSDGDRLIVVTDRRVVSLFRKYLNNEIVSGLKPSKTRAKAPLTPTYLEDTALSLMENAWHVGALTTGGWKAAQMGRWDLASRLLELANVEPMTLKWDIRFDGTTFPLYVERTLAEVRDDLAGVALQWRDMGIASGSWKSPRQLAHAHIDAPLSHIDACWNAGVEAAREWDEQNPLAPLSIHTIARLVFSQTGRVIPGSAYREMRSVVSRWGEYWAGALGESEGDPGADHSAIFREVAEWGRGASKEAIAALLAWRPRDPERTGFNLKWHAVFGTGRATEVMGYHKAVKQHLAGYDTANEIWAAALRLISVEESVLV